MMDAVEQARVRHASDGFCRVIGCPECEVRRQERFGGKILDKVRVEVVEGGVLDFELQDLQREHVLLLAENRRLVVENTELLERVARLNDSVEQLQSESVELGDCLADYVNLAMEANERAQALGAEICGFVGAYVELSEAAEAAGSEEFVEFASLLMTLALNKLHETSHRLAPVQPS